MHKAHTQTQQLSSSGSFYRAVMGHKSLLTGRATCWSGSVGRVPAVGAPPSQHCSLPLQAAFQRLQWGEEGRWRHPREGGQPFCTGHRAENSTGLLSGRALEHIHDALLGLEFGHTNT